MNRWPIVPLGSEVKFFSGGTPAKDQDKYWGGDIPWVSSAEMTQRRIKNTTHSVTQDGAKEGSRLVPSGTVLVVVRGMSLAKEFRVSISTREVTFNQDIKAIYPKPSVDSYFLFYYLLSQSQAIKDSASEAAHGTKKLDMPVLENWPLPIPPIADQRKIVAVISTYDDLIENNQRRIALLEKMAEELYREWFVRLRFPRYEKARFEKSVPAGWKVKQFKDIVEYYIGGGWGEESVSTTFSEGANVIRGTDIPNFNAGIFSAPYRYHKPANLKSRALLAGDIVFEVSGGSNNQLLGRNVLLTQNAIDFLGGSVMCASFCKQIRFKKDIVSPIFMKYFMKLFYESDLVGLYQIQSTGISNYQFEAFLKFQSIIIPSQAMQKTFEEIVMPMIELKDDLSLKNINLKKARDLLLPRLISGKLSVESLDIQFPPRMQEAA